MTRDIVGNQFRFLGPIEPRRDAAGKIVELMPQSRYRNLRGLPLNKYGAGPFCQFRIPGDLPFQGVYALTVDGHVTYIGMLVIPAKKITHSDALSIRVGAKRCWPVFMVA